MAGRGTEAVAVAGGDFRPGDVAEIRRVADRLNQLIATVHPPQRGPYTMTEISERAAELGYQLSTNYLYELRRGSKAGRPGSDVNPTPKALFAIAAVFDVSITYFFTDRDAVQAQTDLALARALNDPWVRDVALKAASLSETTRVTALNLLQELQRLELRIGHGETGAPLSAPAGTPMARADQPEAPHPPRRRSTKQQPV